MNFDILCQESMSRLTKQILEDNIKLNKIKENPEMLLTEIFNGKGCYNQLTDTIETFGKEFTVHDFQKYIYSLLIPFLKGNLGDHYDFSFDANTYRSYLNIRYSGYNLAYVSIYDESVRVHSPLYISILEEDLIHWNEKLNNDKNLLRRFEDTGTNLFKLCKNPTDFFYFIFRLNTYKSEVEHAVSQIKKNINFYIEQLNDTTIRLNGQLSVKDDIKTYTQEIIDYFSKYGYKIYKN